MPKSPSSSAINARAQALRSILQWQKQEHLADSILERHRRGLAPADGALLQSLFYGWLRHQRLLRYWAAKLWKKTPKPAVAHLIELGLLQLLILKLAEHAAVNESVNLAPKPQRGFVNAILREALRQKTSLLAEVPQLPPAIAHSHPDWLLKRWQSQFSSAEIDQLLNWNNLPAPLTARLNPLKPQPTEEKLASQALSHWPQFSEFSHFPSQALEAGILYATDPSTSLAPRLLDPQPEDKILDACAAPGGKSFQLLALAQENHGSLPQLLATDPNKRRLQRLEENFVRLGLPAANAKVAFHDWTQACPPEWRGQFDAVLLDLPCSNTGVLRRRVDARWRIQSTDFPKLAKLQEQIAHNALDAIKPRGRLIWSTCSIDQQENKQSISEFLQTHPQLELEEQTQLTPWQHQVDGAYAAKLTKSTS